MSTLSPLITTLIAVAAELCRSVSIIIFIFGQIGNILTIMVFTQKSLRTNTCSLYILASSVSNIVALTFGMLFIILINGYGITLTARAPILCKIQPYLFYVSYFLSSWFIMLACIDRYYSSHRSAERRQFSRPLIAYRLIIFTTIVSFLVHIHLIIYMDFVKNKCASTSYYYSLFVYSYYMAVYAVMTPVIYIIFGILTIRNVNQSRRAIVPRQYSRQRAINTQIIYMLIIQVISFICLTAPYAIFDLYIGLTYQRVKSLERLVIEAFIQSVLLLWSLINSGINFYIYTLAGTIFRKELTKIINKILTFIHMKRHFTRTVTPINAFYLKPKI
ncbi:unnamed protein product [Didymodactylos carnosus]|uniref:G-protein coupled receptors family 1 profile domain-containing protein n=1 Tax=Didymodactylos carnosus TaxID=1234261 RepID=A0A814JGG8_9BILA|nr:unnamed protein product [Didymodactylos carnosus]CAF1036593.1 unnamed protein product [Didymodactylos carnosus]CAF3771542.1 unnamed protein product [Didymodactylos carnosus]CAF3807135.1 unnamed protein product [Didymodactylos carnosus]